MKLKIGEHPIAKDECLENALKLIQASEHGLGGRSFRRRGDSAFDVNFFLSVFI